MNAAVILFLISMLFGADASSAAPNLLAPAAVPPGTLRLNLSPAMLYEAARLPPEAERTASKRPNEARALSTVKLFESGDMSAALGSDGRIHYRVPSPDILGTKLGGEISTNSVRLTLKWPPRD